MYADVRPCSVCGAAVRLEARDAPPATSSADGPVGPAGGVVGIADEGPDLRVCTNASCPSHDGRQHDGRPQARG